MSACITDQNVRIPDNTSKQIGIYLVKCWHFANGTVSMQGTISVEAPTIATIIANENDINGERFNKMCLDDDGTTHKIGMEQLLSMTIY